MIDHDTLNAIEEMLDRKLNHIETNFDAKLDLIETNFDAKLGNLSKEFDVKLEKQDERLNSKLSPLYREILTLHGMVHGLENDVSDIRSDIAALKTQADYNYDKILNNYGAIKELQTMMEDKADKPAIALYREQ